jgi:quercetin dioxygenase-like cupin family protein
MIRLQSWVFAGAVSAILLAAPVLAQTSASPASTAPSTVRAVLASTALANLADSPRHFKLVRVTLPAKQTSTYKGPVGFVLVLDGLLGVTIGVDQRSVAKGDAVLVPAGERAMFKSGSDNPVTFIHVVLAIAGELGVPMEAPPAVVDELYRTASPIPGLKPGPYEFTIVRVTLPPRFPINPPHRRSGAALYYVLSGTGMFTTGGNTMPRSAGAVHYEPYDLVHQWANPEDEPLVLIQANISQEGVPAVIFVQPGGVGASK